MAGVRPISGVSSSTVERNLPCDSSPCRGPELEHTHHGRTATARWGLAGVLYRSGARWQTPIPSYRLELTSPTPRAHPPLAHKQVRGRLERPEPHRQRVARRQKGGRRRPHRSKLLSTEFRHATAPGRRRDAHRPTLAGSSVRDQVDLIGGHGNGETHGARPTQRSLDPIQRGKEGGGEGLVHPLVARQGLVEIRPAMRKKSAAKVQPWTEWPRDRVDAAFLAGLPTTHIRIMTRMTSARRGHKDGGRRDKVLTDGDTVAQPPQQ